MPPKVSCMYLRICSWLRAKAIHRLVEIARHQQLHAVAIEADQLAQEVDRQQVLALLSSSTMIWVSTERVMSSPVLAS